MISISVNGVDYDVPSSASDTNWAAAQIAFEQALAAGVSDNTTDVTALQAAVTALQTATAPLVWHNLTLEMGWLGTIQYAKDAQGRVWLRGNASASATGLIGTLPTGYRPPGAVPAVTACVPDASGPVDVLQINSAGEFSVTDGASAPEFSLSTIVFDTQAF
jgi:hypothetical protein